MQRNSTLSQPVNKMICLSNQILATKQILFLRAIIQLQFLGDKSLKKVPLLIYILKLHLIQYTLR